MKQVTPKQFQKQFKDEWDEWKEVMSSLSPLTKMHVRFGASYNLSKTMKEMGCEGQGIGSSDVNHEMFSIWKSCGKDKDLYIKECVGLYEERINE